MMNHPALPGPLGVRWRQALVELRHRIGRTPSEDAAGMMDCFAVRKVWVALRAPAAQLASVRILAVGGVTMQPSALSPWKVRRTMRSEMIHRALGTGAALGDDAKAVADATVRALTSLFAQLKPLVGELALRALYVRSLHLARSSFERPSEAELESPNEMLAPLHQDLVARVPAEARGAAEALLLALANLLVSLIGESLTDRFLHKAWGISPPANSSQVKPL